MNKSAITLLTPDYPPNLGGVATYLATLTREAEGVIEVITPKEARFFQSAWPHWWPLVRLICSLPTAHRPPSVVLVSHVLPFGTAAYISRQMGGPEYAVIFHGLDVRLVRGRWKTWLLRQICHHAKAIIANSEATKHDLQKLVPDLSVSVITPGVEDVAYPSREAARQALELEADELLVVSLSRLVPRKGLDFSLRAMSLIQTKMDVKYVILGGGPDRARLEQVATESRARVIWVPHPTDEDKRRWLAAADVFLLPARDLGEDVEGFGIVFLEAALAGVPSVAGRSGGVSEAVRHEYTGLLVDPNNIQNIRQAVEKLLTDAELRKKLGETARARAKQDFKWSDRWEKMRRLLLLPLSTKY